MFKCSFILLLVICYINNKVIEASGKLQENAYNGKMVKRSLSPTKSEISKYISGDGSVAHPYSGPCGPSPDEIGINLTFPAHLENISIQGETSVADIVKYLSKNFKQLLPLAMKVLSFIVPEESVVMQVAQVVYPLIEFVVTYFMDKKQQETAILEYELDYAITEEAFVNLRSQIAMVSKFMNMPKNNSEDIKNALPVIWYFCGVILELFGDNSSVFQKHHLLATPYFMSFAGLQFSVATLAVAVKKDLYGKDALESMIKVAKLIEIYKSGAIRDRFNRVDGKWPPSCDVFYIFYPKTCYTPIIFDQVPGRTLRQFYFSDDCKMEDAEVCYKQAISAKYEPFFDKIAEQFQEAVKTFQKHC